MRALVSVHRFQVHHVADHLIFTRNAVTAVHIAAHPGNIQRLADIVPLDHRYNFGRERPLIHDAAHAQTGLQGEGDFGHHIGQLFLKQLRAGQWAAELLAVQTILAGGAVTELGGAQRTPRNTISRAVEAAERTFQPLDIRQQSVLAHHHIVHIDHAGDRCAERQLPGDFWCGQALHILFQHKAADRPAMRLALRPNDKDIGDRRVGNPCLVAADLVTARHLHRARAHPAGVGTGVGLGQPETSDQFTAGEARQIFAPLFLAAIGVDRVHHEAGLHTHHAAIAGVDPLHLARDQAIGDIASTNAAIFGGQSGTQQTLRAHLAKDRGVGVLLVIGGDHAGLQRVLCKAARRRLDHHLFLAQLPGKVEGVFPIESCNSGHFVSPQGVR